MNVLERDVAARADVIFDEPAAHLGGQRVRHRAQVGELRYELLRQAIDVRAELGREVVVVFRVGPCADRETAQRLLVRIGLLRRDHVELSHRGLPAVVERVEHREHELRVRIGDALELRPDVLGEPRERGFVDNQPADVRWNLEARAFAAAR